MERRYLTIGVNTNCEKNILLALKNIEINAVIDIIKHMQFVSIEINDYTPEYNYTTKFLKENNLEDENIFFRSFPIDNYGLQMEFYMAKNIKFKEEILEYLVFLIGYKLSCILNAKCIVMFDSMKIPISLFDNGELTNDFWEFNSNFFSNKTWRPGISKSA